MGAVLEVAKLVTASWLYRNWNDAGILLRTYFTAAVIILSVITSMGIFGFLSKAHLENTIHKEALMNYKFRTWKDRLRMNEELSVMETASITTG